MLLKRVGMTVNWVSLGLWRRVSDTSSFVSADSDGTVGHLFRQVGSTRSFLEAHCVKRRWTFAVTRDCVCIHTEYSIIATPDWHCVSDWTGYCYDVTHCAGTPHPSYVQRSRSEVKALCYMYDLHKYFLISTGNCFYNN
jgi:hypothetical protein